MMPRWTPEDDDELMAVYGIRSNTDLAVKFNRSEQTIKQRACQLGITTQVIDDADTGAERAIQSNQAFIVAMASAVRLGLERPPMIGVDKRPCNRGGAPVRHGDVAAAMRGAL